MFARFGIGNQNYSNCHGLSICTALGSGSFSMKQYMESSVHRFMMKLCVGQQVLDVQNSGTREADTLPIIFFECGINT